MYQDTIELKDTIRAIVTNYVMASDTINILNLNTSSTTATNALDEIIKYGVPILTLLIALAAFYVSWLAYKKSKDHNELSLSTAQNHNILSMKPYLIFRANTNTREGKIKLWIANKGLGPCIFTEFKMHYEGYTFYSMFKLFKTINKKPEFKFTDEDFNLDYRLFTAPLEKYALTPNQEKTLIKFQLKEKDKKLVDQYYDEYKKIDFEFSTKDFYENVVSGDFIYSRDYNIDENEKE